MPTSVLQVIRVALLSGVLIFGIVAFVIGPQVDGEQQAEIYSVLRIAFAGVAIGCLMAMKPC